MALDLTKEQTFRLIINSALLYSNERKYRYNTKTKWWCLHCLSVLYVSYNQSGRYAIFCEKCYKSKLIEETAAQYKYMQRLKNIQLDIIENQIYFEEKLK